MNDILGQVVRPEMRPIVNVEPGLNDKDEKIFRVMMEDGIARELTKVGGSPRFLITYQDQPVATSSQYYTLVAHDEVRSLMEKVLCDQGYKEKSGMIVTEQPRPWQRRWTVPLDNSEVKENILGKRESYNIGFSVTNSYDLTLALNVELSMMRMVCKNGLFMPITTREGQIKHITTDNDPEIILSRLRDRMGEAIKNNFQAVNMIESLASFTPHREQLLEIGRKMGLRKYETRILLPKGLVYTFDKDKSYPVDVRMVGSDITTEIDVLNAFTSMANEVQTASRKLEIQSRIYSLIVNTRNSRSAVIHAQQNPARQV